MKSGGKAIIWLVAGFALTLESTAQANNSASSSDGPYRAIVDRNIFDLRPIPPAPVTQGTVTPPPNVKLIGLMMINGHPQGVFSVQDPTPGKQPVSYILSEDQRQATLEVKSINMDGKSARVQIGDDNVVLKLEDPKAPTGPAPAPAGGLAAGLGQRAFGPGGRAAGRAAFPMPVPGQPAAAGGVPSASYSPGASPDAGNGALPTRPVRTDTTADQAVTPEQSLVQMEQMRDQYQQNNDPRAMLLPPNPLQAALQAQQNGGANQQTGDGTTPTTTTTPQLPAWLQPKSHGLPPMPGQ
jgi:hypothetical protein